MFEKVTAEDLTFGVSYSRPFTLFIDKDVINKLGFHFGEPINLYYPSSSISTKTEKKETLDSQRELHSLIFGITQNISAVVEREPAFNSFIDENNKQIDLDTSEELSRFLAEIGDQSQRISQNDVLIGASLLVPEYASDQPEENWFSNPYLHMDSNTFVNIYMNSDIKPEEMKSFSGQIIEKTSVYFCSLNVELNQEMKDHVREKMSNIKYLSNEANYKITHKSSMVHGFLDLDQENDGIEEEKYLIDFSEAEVNFVVGKMGVFSKEEGNFSSDDWDELRNVSSDVIGFKPEKTEDDTLRFRGENSSIEFQKAKGGDIVYRFNHDSKGKIENEIIPKIRKNFQEEVDVKIRFIKPFIPKETSRKETIDNWLFDTNAIYLQDSDNEPRSIANFILSNHEFYQVKVVIPWQVLYEMNEHKNDFGPTANTLDKGFDNLNILKTLNEIEFLDIEIGEIPSEIDNTVIDSSAVTDISILSEMEGNGSGLVSGDKELLQIASFKDLTIFDTNKYIEEITQKRPNLQEKVLDGLNGNLKNKEEIKNIIYKIFDEDDMEHQIQEGEKEQRATELIDGIISSGLVIECPKESEMLLGKTRDVLAVPTFELIKKLDDFIVTAHDKKFLDHSFLIKLQKYIGFKNHELPYINFNLPEELILQIFKDFSTSQISLDYRGGRGPLNQLQKNLFKLNQLFNATYSVAESDPNNNEKMISLTKSARKMDAVLLCTEVEEELLKMAQLLELV